MAFTLTVLAFIYLLYFNDDVKNTKRPKVIVKADEVQEHLRNKAEAVQKVIQAPVEDEAVEDEAKEDFDDDEDDEEDEKRVGDDVDQKRLDDSNEAKEDLAMTFKGPQNERQKAVAEAMKHAWSGYKRFAWGHDHLKPVSKSAQNWFGLGLTIVDALDTLFLMNLREEFEAGKSWVASHLDLGVNRDVNLFETTIRVLGGLLSAFHLSEERVFLEKAKDLGDRLLGAFGSSSGIPYSDVNLKTSRGHAPKWSVDSSTSEVSTIQLEFRDLSRETGNHVYEDKAEAVSRILHDLPKNSGLVPIFVNANTGRFRASSTVTMGARGDSYYEYLIKQWIQTGKTQDYFRTDFIVSMDGVMSKLSKRTVPNDLIFVGELLSGGKTFKPKMDELACFLPGSIVLGLHHGMLEGDPNKAKDLQRFAEELAYTCYLTFARQPTYLAAEINYFNTEPGSTVDFYVKPADSHYLLRPETIESLWYLYYFTGNKTYQEWGWNIFQGIEKYTKLSSGGYTTIGNVKSAVDTRPKDMMESFLLGETFKYLYLLFADDHEVNLDKWVINTEAHLLPVRSN